MAAGHERQAAVFSPDECLTLLYLNTVKNETYPRLFALPQ